MLREIETFLAAVRYGTFTEAGERIGLTQSAVSEQIRRLEDFVGYRLFFRTGRSATLNAEGQDLVPLADQVVSLVAEMRRRHAVSEIRTTLRVGTVASLHSGLVARSMLAFHRVFPNVTLRSMRGEDDLLGQVEREELDLAVMIQPSGDLPGNVVWHHLLTKPFVLIAPAAVEAADWREAMIGRPLHRAAGMVRAQGAKCAWEQFEAKDARRRQSHRRGLLALQRGDRLADLVEAGEGDFDVAEQLPCQMGRYQPVLLAQEERKAERRFQLLDVLADGRLADLQQPRGIAGRSGTQDLPQYLQLTQFDVGAGLVRHVIGFRVEG